MLSPCFRFEVLMQANMLSSEYDEISDMHKKVLRVSAGALFLSLCITFVIQTSF